MPVDELGNSRTKREVVDLWVDVVVDGCVGVVDVVTRNYFPKNILRCGLKVKRKTW